MTSPAAAPSKLNGLAGSLIDRYQGLADTPEPRYQVEIGTSATWAWNTFRADRGRWLAVGSVFLVINVATAVIGNVSSEVWISWALPAVAFVLSQVFALGLTRLALGATGGERPDLATLLDLRRIVPWLAAWVLFAVALAIGFVLLIVPFALLYLAFGFWGFVFVDRDLDVRAAFRASNDLSRGKKVQLLLFWVVIAVLVLMLVSLTFGLAAIVAYPVSYLAIAHAYRNLSGDPIPAARG